MNPRIERFAQFEHLAVMDGEVTLPLLIPRHVADEGMDVKIGIVGAAGFMLEQGRDHFTRGLGYFLIGQVAAPVPHRDLCFKPTQFLFHGGI